MCNWFIPGFRVGDKPRVFENPGTIETTAYPVRELSYPDRPKPDKAPTSEAVFCVSGCFLQIFAHNRSEGGFKKILGEN